MNTHGKSLLQIYKTSDIYAINNLTYKSNHFDGNLTDHKGNKSSQNNICLTNNYGLDYLESFKIDNIVNNPSDHAPISIACKFPYVSADIVANVSQDINTNAGESIKLKNRKINQHNIIWDAYKNTREKDLIIFAQKIDNLYNNPSINSLNEFVYKLSCTLRKNAATLSTNSKPHVTTNVPPIRKNNRNLVNDIDTDTSTLYSNFIQQQKDRWNFGMRIIGRES